MMTHLVCIDNSIATGINDKKGSVNSKEEERNLFVESPLPFFYLIYAMDEKFIVTINGDKILLNKDQCIFIKKSVPFSVLLDWDKNGLQRNDIYAVRFSSESLSEFNVLYDSQFEKLQKITSKANEKINDYYFFDFSGCEKLELETIHCMVNQAVLNNIDSKSECFKSSSPLNKVVQHYLLAQLLSKNKSIDALYHEPSSQTLSERVANIVMKDYSINWTNEAIAKDLHVSVSSLKKKMYEEVGSISVFIHKIKLTEALRRLRRTSESISQISTELGYCSASYFTLMFKRYFNAQPSDIRNNDKSGV